RRGHSPLDRRIQVRELPHDIQQPQPDLEADDKLAVPWGVVRVRGRIEVPGDIIKVGRVQGLRLGHQAGHDCADGYAGWRLTVVRAEELPVRGRVGENGLHLVAATGLYAGHGKCQHEPAHSRVEGLAGASHDAVIPSWKLDVRSLHAARTGMCDLARDLHAVDPDFPNLAQVVEQDVVPVRGGREL